MTAGHHRSAVEGWLSFRPCFKHGTAYCLVSDVVSEAQSALACHPARALYHLLRILIAVSYVVPFGPLGGYV